MKKLLCIIVTMCAAGVLLAQITNVPVTPKDSIIRVTITKIEKVSPPPANLPPSANAGIDKSITLPENSVSLAGSGTDADGVIKSYSWNSLSGAGIIATPGSANTVVTNLTTPGLFTFRLTVTDNNNAAAFDDIIITVNPASTGGVKYLTLPVGTPQTYAGKSNLVIENLQFGNKNASFQNGNTLQFSNCHNITVRNCYFSSSAGAAIYILDGSTNIKIENGLFAYNKTAIIVSKASGVKAINCQAVNMYGSGQARGEFYKLIECTGAGFEVSNCRVDNFPGESTPEDIVSLFMANGTPASPILIKDNIIRGGGPSQSGGGFALGDAGGSNVLVTNNTLMNPGQYGIGIASGTNITVTGNKIYSDQFPWSNNPLFVWNQYATACNNITMTGNRVNWTDKAGAKNNGWNAGNCSSTNYNPALNGTITKAEMNVPEHLISFLTPAELLQVRNSK